MATIFYDLQGGDGHHFPPPAEGVATIFYDLQRDFPHLQRGGGHHFPPFTERGRPPSHLQGGGGHHFLTTQSGILPPYSEGAATIFFMTYRQSGSKAGFGRPGPDGPPPGPARKARVRPGTARVFIKAAWRVLFFLIIFFVRPKTRFFAAGRLGRPVYNATKKTPG